MPPKYNRLIEHDEDDQETLIADALQASKESVAASSSSQTDRLASSSIRPETYYEDGPFEAPSSDEEDEALLEKPPSPSFAERGGFRNTAPSKSPYRSASLRALVISLAGLIGVAALIGLIAAHTYKGSTYRIPGVKRITMDHVFNGTFMAQAQSLHWVPEAGDGVFSIFSGGDLNLVDLKTNKTKKLLNMVDIKDEKGRTLIWNQWQLSPDMKYVLLKADPIKQWRWSSFGNYFVHNLETKETRPITPPSNPPVTAYAAWSPTGESIAFVKSNDLYVLVSPESKKEPIRVTSHGNASLFHGVPDWVYEEEVFSSDFTLWWSPDSSKVAFLRLDETAVDEYKFPIYNPTEDSDAVIPYTKDVVMKYPKPGYNNPLVSVHVFDVHGYLEETLFAGPEFPAQNATVTLDWDGRHKEEDSVIMEVAWVGNSSLIVKEVNRNADDGNVVLFDLDEMDSVTRTKGKVVRKLGKNGEEGDDGWIEQSQNIRALPDTVGRESAYLDIVPTPEGYNHIALFSPVSSSEPKFLTSGEWEVTDGIQAVDIKAGLVYYQAARPSTSRHLYSVPIPKDKKAKIAESKALTDTSESASYRASFSPQAGFYLLSYAGPNIPWQKVIQVNNTDFDYVLTDNKWLNATWNEYELPIVTHSTIDSDGFELNVKEIRPPRMDASGRTKYPVLFRVYGGPGSQLVDMNYGRDWHTYVACGLQYIVVIVDGRGTGYKGRKLRNTVKNNLGFWETKDQINAARIWAAKEYVDPKRIGIWGWSYGGFMSSKVIEADAGIHSLAMAVAPVTSWRLYDSIYTERYMNLPALNPGGYVNASISNVTGFHNADYLLAHGSGDDNVHFANSAHLLDMLTKEQVRNFRFRMFTDSDHSIRRRGANREVYEYLTGFLVEKWGKGGRRRGW